MISEQTELENTSKSEKECSWELEELKRKIKLLERDNRMLTIMNDNAERLRRSYEAEKKLQYLYSDLLLESCPNMLFLFNEQLRLVSCSSACQPLLAIQDKIDLANQPFTEVFTQAVVHDWIDKVFAQNQEVLESRQPFSYDDAISFLDGRILYTQVAISPIIDENDLCIGTIMSVNDITELTCTKQKAEEAARSKSSFLANMSHEIRTPMNAVKGLSELLALTELNELQRNYVQNIVTSSNSLLSIINDVLDFSKIDANKVELIEGPYNLPDLVTGVCNVVNFRADNKDLLILIEASAKLPTKLKGDDIRLTQILTNILTNAVKYTKEGYVLLRLFMEERNHKNCLVFSIEDSGIGIRQEDIATLFNAFSRADLRLNRSINGTGLGLAIAKQLVIAMGGDITVESEYGKGSVFEFWVPQEIVDGKPIAEIVKNKNKKVLLLETGGRAPNIIGSLNDLGVECVFINDISKLKYMNLDGYSHCIFDDSMPIETLRKMRKIMCHCRFASLKDMRHTMSLSDYQDTILYLPVFITDLAEFINLKGREKSRVVKTENINDDITVVDTKILVVDDNEINLLVSGEMLRSFNAEVTCVECGEEAITACSKEKYDLIFMDHMMPGLDGVETTTLLRNQDEMNKMTPIVALTANVVNDMESYYLQCGMNDFIGKPIELNELGRVLGTWLPKQKICSKQSPVLAHKGANAAPDTMSLEQLIAAMDNFGLYSSDVMRELNGDTSVYIKRMEEAENTLEHLVNKLKKEVFDTAWENFAEDCMVLRELLYSIGARDCAARARKLALAARNGNITYVHDDFFSLMGNMYMLNKKLAVLVPVAKGGNLAEFPLNVPQYLHACLDKMGRAIRNSDAVETMLQIENAAAFSLDMDLDMALKKIKNDINSGDFNAAKKSHIEIFRQYSEQFNLTL